MFADLLIVKSPEMSRGARIEVVSPPSLMTLARSCAALHRMLSLLCAAPGSS